MRRQFRSYPDDRQSTPDIDERHPAARGRDHLGTPRRNPGPLGVARPAFNKPRTQPDRTRAGYAVVAYLCNFLDENDEKPWKVLKAAGLVPKTDADWHTADAVNALYTAAQRYMPQTLETDMLLTRSLLSRILTLTLIRFKFFSMSFVGNVQGLFSCFSFSLRSLPGSHVEGSSLTTSLCYQDLRSFL